MENQLICLNHKNEVIAVCLEKDCVKRLICYKCLAHEHRNCKNWLLIEDIVQNNITQILKLPKIQENREYSDFDLLASFVLRKDKIKDIENMFTRLVDQLVYELNKIKDTMIEDLNSSLSISTLSAKLLETLSLQGIEGKLATLSKVEIEKEISKRLAEPAERQSSTLNLNSFKNEVSIEESFTQFKQIKKKIEESVSAMFPYQQRKKVFFKESTYDYRYERTNISKDKAVFSEYGGRAVFSKTGFMPNTGIYKFILGISGKFKTKEVWFGLAEEDSYRNFYLDPDCLSSQNAYYCPSHSVLAATITDYSDKFKFYLRFNSNKGVFTVSCKGEGILKKADLNRNRSFRLFVYSKVPGVTFKIKNY